jgi:hypothetical protein
MQDRRKTNWLANESSCSGSWRRRVSKKIKNWKAKKKKEEEEEEQTYRRGKSAATNKNLK